MAGRYDNPIPTRCLAPIDFLKIPAQGVTKRCFLSWLTSSALVYEPKKEGGRGGGLGGSQSVSTAVQCALMVGSLKMNTTLEYSTRVVQEGGRRCKKSTLNDLTYLTPLRIPLMNPVLEPK
jgi:hypothetical protein